MGESTQNMAGTPDPKDTGAVGVPENSGADETTVFQPVGLVEEAENTDGDGKKPRPKWLVPAIAGGVAVVVLGAGIGGYAYALNNVNSGVNAASAWNTETVKTLQESVKDAQTLLDETGEDRVADPQVLEALSSAIDKARAVKGVNEMPSGLFVWELLDAENKYDESTNRILDLDANLGKAVKAVEQSVQDKTLRDAKDTLSRTIGSAQSTLDGSNGKVQDNATRDALSKAIDTARKALDGDDVEATNTAKSDLEAKTNAVDDSVKAKEQADAEAKAQADASAAASTNTSGGYTGYTGGGYTGSYSGGNYGNGGNYSGGGSYTGNTGGSGSYHGGDTDSVGGVWSEMNSNCAIYGSDGSVTEVPCS